MRPAPLLVAVLTLTAGCVGQNGDSGPDPVPTTVPTTTTTTTVRLGAALDWPRERETTCATWHPPAVDTILRVDTLEPDCLAQARLDATTIIVTPYGTGELLGEPAPWRTIDGADVGRIADGPLAEMSSRYVDGIACAACDQTIVVTGPDPEKVRRLVESVEAGSQFPPDPDDFLHCQDGMTTWSIDWLWQNARTPRGAAEEYLDMTLPDAEIEAWENARYVLVPDASGTTQKVVTTFRNEKGTWDAAEVWECSG